MYKALGVKEQWKALRKALWTIFSSVFFALLCFCFFIIVCPRTLPFSQSFCMYTLGHFNHKQSFTLAKSIMRATRVRHLKSSLAHGAPAVHQGHSKNFPWHANINFFSLFFFYWLNRHCWKEGTTCSLVHTFPPYLKYMLLPKICLYSIFFYLCKGLIKGKEMNTQRLDDNYDHLFNCF